MARKRSRLHGTPQEHERMMKDWGESAASDFSEAIEASASHKCGKASRLLMFGERALGAAEMNLYGATRLTTGSGLVKVRALGSEARSSFESRCLINRDLAGLRRRSRR
jgi:hypothetical protein